MTSPYRLLVIADVGGDDARHIGDEAMLEANLAAFRRLLPGVTFTVVSRDPVWTAARYEVEAVAPFGFSRERPAAQERGAILERVLAGQSNPTSDALARSDGLVVSGGGNLSSTWPDLFYERAVLLLLAHNLGKPAVVLGQTIGPRLDEHERTLLTTALSSARFVGVRELPSAAMALGLGVDPERIWYQCDDALTVHVSDRRGAETIAVTIDPQVRAAGDLLFTALTTQLRELSLVTGAPLMLIPHAFGDESAPSDLIEAEILAEHLALPNTIIASGLDATSAIAATRGAALVISTRYHPIIFGLSGGVASIGIYGDEYCRIKLEGALAHARLEHWTLTYDDVARERLLPQARELWRTRDDVRRGLESRHEVWRAESRVRWSAILRALATEAPPQRAPSGTLFNRPLEEVAPALASALESSRRAWESERQSLEQQHHQAKSGTPSLRQTLRRYTSALLRRIGQRQR